MRSTNDRDHQNQNLVLDDRHPDGYNPTVALPIEIYHPAFAKFLANIRNTDLEVPTDVVQPTARIIEEASKIATAEPQREMTYRILADVLKHNIRSSKDYILPVYRTEEPKEVAAATIVEEKGELGWSGDPSIHGTLAYLAFWSDGKVRLILVCLNRIPSFPPA